MGGLTMRNLGLMLVAVSSMTAADDDEVSFARVQGSYASSTLHGWLLKLDEEGNAVLDFDGPLTKEKALARGGRVGIHLPRLVPPGEAVGLPAIVEDMGPLVGAIPPPRVDRRGDSWPPSLRDPTAPVVMPRASDRPSADDRVWLTPVVWTPRLYLVRDVVEFCKEVASGAEPRQAAEGTAFLRVGDHLKAVVERVSPQCRNLR